MKKWEWRYERAAKLRGFGCSSKRRHPVSRKKIRGFVKQPVERTVVIPETSERKILTNPETGELEVIYITAPAVFKQGRALGSTTKGGQTNDVKNMAPKGGKMSKSGPQSGGKK